MCSGGSLPRKHHSDCYMSVFLKDGLRFYCQENGFSKKKKRQCLSKTDVHFLCIMKYYFKSNLNCSIENKTECLV